MFLIITAILSVVVVILLVFIVKEHKVFSKEYKSLVLVKVSNPTKSQIERYIEWQKTMSSDYRFEILSDKYLKISNMTINIIYPEELFKKWPKISNMLGSCYNKGKSHDMWVSIVEHYVLCANKSKIQFKYLWMVEQDLGYTGNLYEFMKQYEGDEIDIISKEYEKKDPSWWPECYTPEYYMWRIKFHPNYKYQSYNWITRLSKRAIDLLYNEFELGRHVPNEEALPERIEPLKMTFKPFNSNYYGYKYDWHCTVSEKEWDEILKEPKHKNKLFHALKF